MLLGCGIERRRKVISSADVVDLQGHAERARRFLQWLHLQRRDRIGEVGQHQHGLGCIFSINPDAIGCEPMSLCRRDYANAGLV